MDEQTDKTMVIVRCSKSLLDYTNNKFSRKILENSPNNSLEVVKCGGTGEEMDGHYESNLTIPVRHYKWHIYRRPA